MKTTLFKLKFREPENWEVDMNDFYIKTGCIKDEDLEKILGDQGIGISVFKNK